MKSVLRCAVISAFSCIVLHTLAPAQDLPLFTRGLAVYAGYGWYAVHDEAVSQEKYTGPMSKVMVDWTDIAAGHGHRLLFDYGWSNQIKNNNVSAEVQEILLRFDLIYPLGHFDLLKGPVRAFLGPSLGGFVTQRREDIAGSSDSAPPVSSGTSFGSLSVVGLLNWSLSPSLEIGLSSDLTVLSIVGKNQSVQKNEPQAQVLTFINAMCADLHLLLRFHLTGTVTCAGGYEGRLVRVDEWDYLVSGRDLFVFGLEVGL